MPQALPERVWPLRLTRRGEWLQGSLDGPDLPRVVEAAECVMSDVGVRLGFQHMAGEDTVQGQIRVSLVLRCQRCLEPMQWQSDIDVIARFVPSGRDDDGSELESVPLDDDGSISLREFVEDEILLAMPQFPLHDENECPVRPEPVTHADTPKRPNPFAVLAKTKAADPID